MSDDAAAMREIANAESVVRRKEQELEAARTVLAAAYRDHDGIEELAILLWVESVKKEEDSYDLLERWERDPAERDRDWMHLQIESERDDFRKLAKSFMDIALGVVEERADEDSTAFDILCKLVTRYVNFNYSEGAQDFRLTVTNAFIHRDALPDTEWELLRKITK